MQLQISAGGLFQVMTAEILKACSAKTVIIHLGCSECRDWELKLRADKSRRYGGRLVCSIRFTCHEFTCSYAEICCKWSDLSGRLFIAPTALLASFIIILLAGF